MVTIGWVLFRADNTLIGLRYISRMLMPWRHMDLSVPTWKYMDSKTIFIFVCAVLGMGIVKTYVPEKIKKAWSNSVIEAIYCVFILLLCLASVASDTYNPFIYFQF